MKTLYCRDAGFDCDEVIRGETEGEVLSQAATHAREVHGINPTPEIAEELSYLIKED